MKRFAIVLAACASKDAPPPPPPPAPPPSVPVDAASACPGSTDDCAACASGKGAACTRVGDAAVGDAQRPWFERGCTFDDLAGCVAAQNFGTHDDLVRLKARVAVLQAAEPAANRTKCDVHDEPACLALGKALAFGAGGTPQDRAAAEKILDASCDRGSVEACWASALASDDRRTQETKAMRACKRGHAKACGAFLGSDFKSASAATARAELERRCRANASDACEVLEEVSHGMQTPR